MYHPIYYKKRHILSQRDLVHDFLNIESLFETKMEIQSFFLRIGRKMINVETKMYSIESNVFEEIKLFL